MYVGGRLRSVAVGGVFVRRLLDSAEMMEETKEALVRVGLAGEEFVGRRSHGAHLHYSIIHTVLLVMIICRDAPGVSSPRRRPR